MKVLNAAFLTTAVEPKGYPGGERPEVAFFGRSNVGKSSMINSLCQRKGLVRVSNTPGRTQTLNFFDVDLDVAKIRFCDLPGYGFAKVGKADRARWQEMIGAYLAARDPLRAVVGIVDAFVGPTVDDQQVIQWMGERGRRVLVAANKIDQIPKHKRIPKTREIAEKLMISFDDVTCVSSLDKIGLETIWERILAAAAL